MQATRTSAALLALLASASLLSACGRDDSRSAGQKLDSAVAKAERKSSEVAAEARQAGREAGQAVGQAADKVASQAKDFAISAEVKASLARDAKLGSMSISVETAQGHVLLQGSAPDAEARTHAAELARAVEGVVAVDNKLDVLPRS